MKKKTLYKLIILGTFILSVIVTLLIGKSFAGSGPTVPKINQDTEFMYNISVKYENIDNDISGEIEVEDILPEGLTFVGFSNVYNKYSDNNTSCLGHIKKRPTYDENTRKITYSFENLGSSCYFSVGVVVKSGTTDSRVDYYNTASAVNNGETYYSNTARAYIGNEGITGNTVSYVFQGLPTEELNSIHITDYGYSQGQEVVLETPPVIHGYTFKGYTSNDVTIANNSFTMPNSNVTITGTYEVTQLSKHKVSFVLSVNDNIDFPLLDDLEYYEGETVDLSTYDDIDYYRNKYSNKYMFNGISILDNNITMVDKKFTMPNRDVVVQINFEPIPYVIKYTPLGLLIPSAMALPNNTNNYFEKENSSVDRLNILYDYHINYLDNSPNEISIHNYGDKISLINNQKSTTCLNKETNEEVKCKFLGWLYNDEVTMPAHHIEIFGTWMEITGTFEPEINVEITNPKDYYEKDEVVEFKTIVTNTSDVEIRNLKIENNFKDQVFVSSNNYRIEDDYIIISSIQPNESIIILSSYVVGENANRNFVNEFEIVSAEADEGYYLENEEYKSSVDFNSKKTGDSTPVSNDTNNTNTTNDTVIEKNETVPKDTNNTPNNESTVPKTSDNAYIYILLLVGSLILIIAIVIVFIKNKKNK